MINLALVIPWALTVAALFFIIFSSKQEEDEEENFMFDDSETVRVAVYEEKAYWVYDNVFYEAEVLREPDFTTAQPIDTMSMSPKDLNRLMSILDELENTEKE